MTTWSIDKLAIMLCCRCQCNKMCWAYVSSSSCMPGKGFHTCWRNCMHELTSVHAYDTCENLGTSLCSVGLTKHILLHYILRVCMLCARTYWSNGVYIASLNLLKGNDDDQVLQSHQLGCVVCATIFIMFRKCRHYIMLIILCWCNNTFYKASKLAVED